MENDAIKAALSAAIEGAEVHVQGDGYHHQVIVVSEVFTDLRPVKRQQMVYAPLMDVIGKGELHALSIKAFTPSEWQRERKLLMPS